MDKDRRQLLTKKGILYAYSIWMHGLNLMKQSCRLKVHFMSKLNDLGISDKDYKHPQTVWTVKRSAIMAICIAALMYYY